MAEAVISDKRHSEEGYKQNPSFWCLKVRSYLSSYITWGDNIKIQACINCGSTNLRSGAAIDGIVPGDIPLVYICNECEHKGAPIIFDSVEEYSKFQKALNE